MATLTYNPTLNDWTGTVNINYTTSYNAANNSTTITFSESNHQYFGRANYETSARTTITVTAADNTSSKATVTFNTSGYTLGGTDTFSGTPSPASVTVSHSSGAGSKIITISASTTVSVYLGSGLNTISNESCKGSASVISTTLYTLTKSAGTGSTITVNNTTTGESNIESGALVAAGSELEILFGLSTGYKLGTHAVNGSTFTSGNKHTVSGDVAVFSTASVKSYTLTISAGTGSTITVSRTSSPLQGADTGTLSNKATIYHSDVLKITFGVSTGYALGDHTVNNNTFTSSNPHTVDGNVSVVSTATVLSYLLSVSALGGAIVTVNRTSSPKQGAATGSITDGDTVYYSDVLVISFIAPDGYDIAAHEVNGSIFISGNTHTVTGAVSIVASAVAADVSPFSLYTLFVADGEAWVLATQNIVDTGE